MGRPAREDGNLKNSKMDVIIEIEYFLYNFFTKNLYYYAYNYSEQLFLAQLYMLRK